MPVTLLIDNDCVEITSGLPLKVFKEEVPPDQVEVRIETAKGAKVRTSTSHAPTVEIVGGVPMRRGAPGVSVADGGSITITT